MTNQESTFQNNHIKVEITREPGCIVKAEVNVTPQGLLAARHAAIKAINKEVSIPGFRKGKAPEAIIIDRYQSHIDKEWQNQLSRLTFYEMIELTGIHPLNNTKDVSAKVDTFSPTDGAKVTYKYEVSAEVPAIIAQDITLKAIPVKEINEEDVNKYLEQLRQQDMTFEPITDRTTQDDDFLDVEVFQIGDDGEVIVTQAEADKKFRTQLSADNTKMDDWIYKALSGIAINQTVEAHSESKENTEECRSCETGEAHTHEPMPPKHFRFTLHAINRAILPELTDEFAKKLGAENLEDLKSKVMTNLTNASKEQQKNAMREQLKHCVIEKYAFELPGSIIRTQLDSNIDQLKKFIATIPEEVQNQEFQKIVNKISQDLCFYFLVKRFANDHHINISEDIIDSELTHQMWYKALGKNTFNLPDDPKDARTHIHQHLLIKEVLDTLMKNAQIEQHHLLT